MIDWIDEWRCIDKNRRESATVRRKGINATMSLAHHGLAWLMREDKEEKDKKVMLEGVAPHRLEA